MAHNCLSESHVKVDCTSPARCFNCLDGGHQAHDCPLPARPAPSDGKRGRSPARPAWCAHPDLIPDEKILTIPEPEEEHDGGPPSSSGLRRSSTPRCWH